MVPLLEVDIDQDAPNVYIVRLHIDGELLEPERFYPDIRSAILAEARLADGETCFISFTYGGMSTGTLWCNEAQEHATRLADRLNRQCGELHGKLDEGLTFRIT